MRVRLSIAAGSVVLLAGIGIGVSLHGSAVSPRPGHLVSAVSDAARDACQARELFIGVRGSGDQSPADPGVVGSATLGSVAGPVFGSFSQAVGSLPVAADPTAYVAVSVPDVIQSVLVAPNLYSDSYEQGATQLINQLYLWNHKCPAYRFVLAGYSQGADIVGSVLAHLDASNPIESGIMAKIDGVALFGDPRYNPADTIVDVNPQARSGGLMQLRLPTWVPGIRHAPPAWIIGRVRSWCVTGDPICDFNPLVFPDCNTLAIAVLLNQTPKAVIAAVGCFRAVNAAIGLHGTYGSAAAGEAGRWLASLVNSTSAGPPPGTPAPPPAPTVCAAFVADATVPDGTPVPAGAQLGKTWVLRNCGTISWAGLHAQRVSGDFGPAQFPVPAAAPGAQASVSTVMTAPPASGEHRATYALFDSSGTRRAGNFWIDITVTAALALPPVTAAPPITQPPTVAGNTQPPAPTPTTAHPTPTTAHPTPTVPPPPNRHAITSYDEMRGGAPYHGYFTTAFQSFTAASNTITYLSATVGSPGAAAGTATGQSLLLRLCTDANCADVIAQAQPQIINYGETAADIGNVAVTPGATYYLVWYQPQALNGSTWVTYWWAGGPTISTSDRMQAAVRGYNR